MNWWSLQNHWLLRMPLLSILLTCFDPYSMWILDERWIRMWGVSRRSQWRWRSLRWRRRLRSAVRGEWRNSVWRPWQLHRHWYELVRMCMRAWLSLCSRNMRGDPSLRCCRHQRLPRACYVQPRRRREPQLHLRWRLLWDRRRVCRHGWLFGCSVLRWRDVRWRGCAWRWIHLRTVPVWLQRRRRRT